jgi:hypothetical protein
MHRELPVEGKPASVYDDQPWQRGKCRTCWTLHSEKTQLWWGGQTPVAQTRLSVASFLGVFGCEVPSPAHRQRRVGAQ